MREEAASGGFYTSPGWNTKHPRIQLITVEELLAGKQLDNPHMTRRTFRKAPKHLPAPEQPEVLFGGDGGLFDELPPTLEDSPAEP